MAVQSEKLSVTGERANPILGGIVGLVAYVNGASITFRAFLNQSSISST